MPDSYNVGTATAVFQPADTLNQKKIINASGGTLYYKTSSDVTTSSSDGNLTTGQSLQTSTPQWLIGNTPVNVIVDTQTSLTASDLTATDDLSVTDDATITDTLTVGGVTTTTGGIATAVAPPGFCNTPVTSVTNGTDTAGADGTQWVTSIFIPVNKTITNINYLVGSGGGTDKVYGVLYDASGTNVKNTSLTGGGATAGTAAQIQTLALTATYAAKGPALYYVGISHNGATAKIRTVPAHMQSGLIAGSVSQTQGVSPTVAAITPPSGFTANKAPYVFLD